MESLSLHRTDEDGSCMGKQGEMCSELAGHTRKYLGTDKGCALRLRNHSLGGMPPSASWPKPKIRFRTADSKVC